MSLSDFILFYILFNIWNTLKTEWAVYGGNMSTCVLQIFYISIIFSMGNFLYISADSVIFIQMKDGK